MIVEDQSEVIAFLSRPETYGGSIGTVEQVETHISIVFLAGDRAFKLKRAVKFPYLDFSTRERRRRFCEVEVRVNRRTAPELYLRVLPVTRGSDGRLELGGGGEPVDWVVEMVRFDQDTLFDRLAERGRLDRSRVEDLADTVARFHDQAERRFDAGGHLLIARIIENNLKSFAECPAGSLDANKVWHLTEASERSLLECADLLDQRRRSGCVRHCHGDLHLRNICLYQGRAILFDAIEFDPELAEIDVLYDLAFLIMDLNFRGLIDLASILLNRYLDNTGDAGGLKALPLFLSLRAAIRSHVDAATAASQSQPEKAQSLLAGAQRYLDLAVDYLKPRSPRLIAIGGLSGTGKSRLARDLAPHLGSVPGARVVRTDSTRKRMCGISLESRLDSTAYTSAMNKRTYRAVLEEARTALTAGLSVIADAVFAAPAERETVARIARDCNVPFQALWLETRPEVMQERVSQRQSNVSDATVAVVRKQLTYDVGQIDWPRLDTSGTPDETLQQASRRLGLEKA